ncbi:MAG TPA: TetR/AcrR family transcriptional regulator [bacterium]|nr:TetR/AcrR family transcriptional regulator [bacterium]
MGMPRPSTADQRRAELLPIVAKTFARTGYGRATTAGLARSCGVAENTLFRLWGGKKAMYLASLDYLYESTVATWRRCLTAGRSGSRAEILLAHEGKHYGEHGMYRIVFTGLAEIDDGDIRQALRTMYRRFHGFLRDCIVEHRGADDETASQLAWTVIGMATVAGIGRALRLITKQQQRELFADVGSTLLAANDNEP